LNPDGEDVWTVRFPDAGRNTAVSEIFMTTKPKKIDNFDRAYRDRIRDVVWDAILEASRDPTTNVAPLRNYEIYDALLQLQAIILARSKQAGSAAEMRVLGAHFAKRLRRLVAEFKKTYDRDGAPFAVLHTDEMQ
jgi:hypothetical protein